MDENESREVFTLGWLEAKVKRERETRKGPAFYRLGFTREREGAAVWSQTEKIFSRIVRLAPRRTRSQFHPARIIFYT